MSRTIVINTVFAAVLAAGVGAAQTTPPTSGSQASSKSGQSAKGTQSQNVTLTGCVEADQAASGTSGSGTTGKSSSANATSTGSGGACAAFAEAGAIAASRQNARFRDPRVPRVYSRRTRPAKKPHGFRRARVAIQLLPSRAWPSSTISPVT